MYPFTLWDQENKSCQLFYKCLKLYTAPKSYVLSRLPTHE